MGITQFSCWRNDKKENEKSPDYKLTTKDGDRWITIGAGWVKSAGDKKYISFSLSKPYKEQSGYRIIEDKPDERIASEDQGKRTEDVTFEVDDFDGL